MSAMHTEARGFASQHEWFEQGVQACRLGWGPCAQGLCGGGGCRPCRRHTCTHTRVLCASTDEAALISVMHREPTWQVPLKRRADLNEH